MLGTRGENEEKNEGRNGFKLNISDLNCKTPGYLHFLSASFYRILLLTDFTPLSLRSKNIDVDIIR